MSCELDPHLLLLHHPLDDGPLLWSEMGQVWPLAALAGKSRGSTSSMEKPVKGRLVVHPATAKSHFGLPPTENTMWPLVARVRSVWYVRERAEEALFLQREPPPAQSGEQSLEISPLVGELKCRSTSIPSPSLPVSPPRSEGRGRGGCGGVV